MTAITQVALADLLRQAVALHQSGKLPQARDIYEQILRRQPRHFDSLHMLGVIAAMSGDPRRGIELIGQATQVDPANAIAHNNLGLAQQQAGQPDAALASFDNAAKLRAGYADPHYHRGNLLSMGGHWDAALQSFDRAIALRSEYAEAHCDRGIVLCRMRQWDLALASFDRAIALKRDLVAAYSNRAVALRELQRFDEALNSCRQAIELNPDHVDGYCNLAGVLVALQRVAEALENYDKAISKEPQNASAHVNRALARLLAGDFAGGWEDYEWRWKDTASWVMHEKRNFLQPLWLGQTSLVGQRILLQSEQGFGDTIQFCRYATCVAELGAEVILEVPQALATLARSLSGVAEVVVQGETLPSFDCYCPLLSLPLALRTTLHNIPHSIPYLRPDESRRSRWKARVASGPRMRVGLAWSGAFRPGRPELWSANSRRNLPLQKLALLHDAEIDFYSLQKDAEAASDLAQLVRKRWAGPSMHDFATELVDFADTAALIEQLDLVISVDTAIAHLAGALGKPVWILNRFDTCWRWMLERDDSPWYPTARIYRQRRPGDWDEVLLRVRMDLRKLGGRP